MIHTDRAIVVEGKYDKIKLGGLIDGVILCTGGFRIYKDKEMQQIVLRVAVVSAPAVHGDRLQVRLEQKGDAALLTLESDSVNAPQMAVQLADDQLWQAVEQSLDGAAQHPSWLYKLIDAPSVRVSFQRQTGVEDFPAVTDTSRSPYVQKMLGDITVQPGSFERVSKDKTLKGAVSFEADNVSHYQISMTESQLLIQNDSVSYGALFALEDGEKTLQALQEALGIF